MTWAMKTSLRVSSHIASGNITPVTMRDASRLNRKSQMDGSFFVLVFSRLEPVS
jgi:hypothetical protein